MCVFECGGHVHVRMYKCACECTFVGGMYTYVGRVCVYMCVCLCECAFLCVMQCVSICRYAGVCVC